MKSRDRKPIRCTSCRVVLSRKQQIDCIVIERPYAKVDRQGKVIRGVESLVLPYCPLCCYVRTSGP